MPDSTAAWVEANVMPPSPGVVGQLGDGPVGGAQHHPGIAGELIAHRTGRLPQPVQRLRDGADLGGVQHQLADPRPVVRRRG